MNLHSGKHKQKKLSKITPSLPPTSEMVLAGMVPWRGDIVPGFCTNV